MLSAVCNILALEEGKSCMVVGTLYKQMQLKPSVLDEYSKEVREFGQWILSAFFVLIIRWLSRMMICIAQRRR